MTTSTTPFDVRTSADGTHVTVVGDVTEQAVPVLLAALAPIETHGGTVNLTAVTFLPSRATGELVASRRRAVGAGRQMRLVAAEYTIAASVLRVTAVPHDHA